MPKRSIGEQMERAKARQTRGKQILAKAEQEIARLKEIDNKARTRRLIELGGLVVKAGLEELSTAALFGGLVKLADEARDANNVVLWERAGGRQFRREQEAAEDTSVIAIARFDGKLLKEVTDHLRGLGFKWNRLLLHWEGKVDFDAAKAFVEGKGGKITKVKNP